MTKIVFTDIDGDYNTPAMRQLADEAVDMTRVLEVRAICEAHGALVVISSSWRANHPAEAQALGFPLHEDWRTESRDDRDRGAEVNEWLSRHPEVTQWVIIDDKNDFTAEQQSRLVFVTTDLAIQPADLAKLTELLS